MITTLYQVDIKYTTPSPAGYYYPEHLPVLGMHAAMQL